MFYEPAGTATDAGTPAVLARCVGITTLSTEVNPAFTLCNENEFSEGC